MFGTRLFNLSLDYLFCFERYSSKSIDDLDKRSVGRICNRLTKH